MTNKFIIQSILNNHFYFYVVIISYDLVPPFLSNLYNIVNGLRKIIRKTAHPKIIGAEELALSEVLKILCPNAICQIRNS